jgi:hypothetical protein
MNSEAKQLELVPDLQVFELPSGPLTPARVEELETAMMQFPQAPCPVIHRFGPGIYMREVLIPKGVFAIGHHQNIEHQNIMLKGHLTMLNEDGTITEMKAPMMYVSKPGRKISYSHEDIVWLNIYPTEETDIERLEQTYLTKSLSWNEAVANLKGVKLIQAALKEVVDLADLPFGGYKIKVAGRKLVATSDIETGEIIAPVSIKGKNTIAGHYVGLVTANPNCEIVNGNLIALKKITGCHGGLDGEEITCQA